MQAATTLNDNTTTQEAQQPNFTYLQFQMEFRF